MKYFVAFALVCAIGYAALSGHCNTDETCNWAIDAGKKLLTISGTGYMANYSTFALAPWLDAEAKEQYDQVVVENGVKCIGDFAFYKQGNLRGITVKGSLDYVGQSMCESCENLTEVTFGGSIAYAQSNAFRYCYGAFTLKGSFGNVFASQGPFFSSRFSSIIIEGEISSLDSNTFGTGKTLLTTVVIGSVEDIGSSTFSEFSKLTSVTIGGLNGTINSYAFSSCSKLESVKLSGVNISIKSYAFSSCYALKSIALPAYVWSISSNGFSYCTSLDTMYYDGIHNPGPNNGINNCNYLDRVIVNPAYEDFIFCGKETKKASSTLASASTVSVAHVVLSLVMVICVLLSQW